MKVLAVCIGFASVLAFQQYQLAKIADTVVDIKADLKFIAQSSGPLVSYSAKDEECLARNIYYEAGVEPENGKYSVGQVTLNRLKTGRWGNTICKVVYARAQFSWTLKKNLHKPAGKSWEESQWIAHRVLRGEHVPLLRDAQFYHADYIKAPKWSDPNALITQVGVHMFYTKAKT